MIHLVQEALDLSAEHVDGGLCSSSSKVLARVNEAVRRLLQAGDYGNTIDQVRYFTQNNSITLSREHVAARMVNICGTPVDIRSRAYEFVKSGPGEFNWDQCAKLIDQGMKPTFFDVPTDYTCHLYAVSTSPADTTLSLTFTGRASNGAEILTSTGSPLQTLAIDAWDVGSEGVLSHTVSSYSTDSVHKLSSIRLPEGRKGYVSLYAIEPSTQRMWFMAKYHPAEATPGYRRYRLPVFCPDNGMQVHCLCKKQYIPATAGTDVLLIQNLDAIKLMVMSVEAENNRDINGAVAMKQLAMSGLYDQESNENRGIQFNFVCTDDCSGVNII